MKKTKILIPVLTVASLAATAMPIVTSCSNESTNKKYKIVWEDVNKVQGAVVTLDKTTYTAKEIEKKGITINAGVSKGTSELTKPALVLEKIIIGDKELVLNTDYFVMPGDEKNMCISIEGIKCSGRMHLIFAVQEYNNIPVRISEVVPSSAATNPISEPNADVEWDPKFIDFANWDVSTSKISLSIDDVTKKLEIHSICVTYGNFDGDMEQSDFTECTVDQQTDQLVDIKLTAAGLISLGSYYFDYDVAILDVRYTLTE